MERKVFKPLFGAIEFEIDGEDYTITKISNDQGQDFIKEMNRPPDQENDPSGLGKSIAMLSILIPDVPKEVIQEWDMGATVELVKYLSEVITKAMTGTVGGTEKNGSSPEPQQSVL